MRVLLHDPECLRAHWSLRWFRLVTRFAGPRHTAVALALVILTSTTAFAQRTDVATLVNGDRMTGEVMRLDRGRLEFKTDDAGTLYLEWDAMASVVTTRTVEVVSADGTRRVGSLVAAPDRHIAVSAPGETDSLPMAVVTHIAPVGRSFWRQLEGSVEAGFSYTRSSGVAQLNVNSNTVYRRPAFQGRVTAAMTYTRQREESERDDRGSLEFAYVRFRWPRAFVGALARFETNESVGLELRSQIAAAIGPRLINSNRSQMFAGAGLAFNDERGVDVEPTQNMEALLLFGMSYFTYDQPSTNVDIGLSYYPSPGRHRVQLDAGVRREIWKDLFVALNLYNTYDSEPPNPEASTNDVGVVLSIGWNY